MKWTWVILEARHFRSHKVRATTLENKNILASLAKAIIVLRLLFVFPIVSSWLESGMQILELVVMILLATESLIGLLYWERIRGFIERHPLVLSLDILLSILVLGFSGTHSPFFLYLSATAIFIGLMYEGTNRLVLSFLTLAAFLLIPLIASAREGLPQVGNPETIITTLGGIATLFILLSVGSALRQLQARTDVAIELAARNAREAALGEERSRVARELHDSTVKSLVGIRLLSSAITKDPAQAPRTAKVIEQAADTAIEESRGILSTLRSQAAPPLDESLRAMVDELEVIHGLPIHLELGRSKLPSEHRYNVRKVIEEAISNAAMHSGTNAIRVQVGTDDAQQFFTAAIHDFGRGFRINSARNGHIGLASMRERADEMRGTVTIASTPGSGTTVTLCVPLQKEDSDEPHP